MAKKTRKMFEYEALINNFPAPGGGGAHVALYRAGALGYEAGVPEDQIVKDVTANIPKGGRTVTQKEIEEGVSKGFSKKAVGIGDKVPVEEKPVAKVPEGTFKRLVNAGRTASLEDIISLSPVPLNFPLTEAGAITIEALYNSDDLLFIGNNKTLGVMGESIRTAKEWVAELNDIEKDYAIRQPHIMVNPLTGEEAPTKSDPNKLSYRGDGNIASFKYMVVEFDEVSLDDQIAFWAVVHLPVAALVMSGGKSIHGWVQVDCSTLEEWEKEVEEDLFPCYLAPLGVDKACRNESRLSRMPGHVRQPGDVYAGAIQRLIYLAPGGRAVCG